MRLLIAVGFCLIACSASAQEASQQGSDDPERHGFWFSAGAGIGSRGLSCTECIGSQRERGFSGNLRLGGTVSPQLTFGANIIGWVRTNSEPSGGRHAVFGALMGVAQYYPVKRSGLYVQGGGGYVVDVVDEEAVIHGVGMTVGLGFDVRVGESFSLTPQFNYVRTLDRGAITSSLYQLGVAVSWH